MFSRRRIWVKFKVTWRSKRRLFFACFESKLSQIPPTPDPESNDDVKISAPNLTRLITNCLYDFFLLENVPNLVQASFFLSELEDTIHKFANAAPKLEILTIYLRHPKAFGVPLMPKLKKLVLDYKLVDRFKKYLLPVTCLLEVSPCLEEFKLEISDLFKYYCQSSSIIKAIFKVPKHGGFSHYDLKVFEFSGFCHEAGDNVALVSYIANNCIALEKIIITPISISLAHYFILRDGSKDMRRRLLSEEVDATADEQQTLDMKKSTEKVLAGKVPDPIKLLIN